MRTRIARIGWWILAAMLLMAPARASAQGGYYEVPPTHFTGFLSHPRYESGGFYIGMESVIMVQSRPIRDQVVAIRGFLDIDGSVVLEPPPSFQGSGAVALNTSDLRGPQTWSPGWNVSVGWRFENGVALQLSWMHLNDARYSVSAGIIPPGFNVGPLLENTFLFSPVTNFSTFYAGPRDIDPSISTPPPTAGALYGIWNGAENMSIEFLQRYEQVDLTARIPVWQTDTFRSHGLLGPRAIIAWERFKWRTTDLDFTGLGRGDWNAVYSNVVSNRMYGVFIGNSSECFLGELPIGGFAASIDWGFGIYGDWAKGRPKYEREDRVTSASHPRNFFRPAGSLEAKVALWWYPWEAISVRIGYDVMCLLNTIGSPHPIDFNMGTIDPEYTGVNRYLHGFHIGIGLVF